MALARFPQEGTTMRMTAIQALANGLIEYETYLRLRAQDKLKDEWPKEEAKGEKAKEKAKEKEEK